MSMDRPRCSFQFGYEFKVTLSGYEFINTFKPINIIFF
jgi:hypothetical protein